MAKFKLSRAFASADSAPINPRIFVLAAQAADQASLLAVMVKAYAALEKVVTHDQDCLERSASRESLGALMRALNGEMERQVEVLLDGTTALQELVLEEAGEW
jgi:hypothetical protein